MDLYNILGFCEVKSRITHYNIQFLSLKYNEHIFRAELNLMK